MERQVLFDKLSEFLMVEQSGLELYRVAASRCTNPTLKQRYEEFGNETERHREILITVIEQMGGDPSYVSPTARLAQVKAAKLLEATLLVDGLSQEEVEANDLENLVLAETKDHADWHLLEQVMQQADDEDVKRILQQVVGKIEEEEDTHLQWARETLGQMALQMVLKGPAPSPERWQKVLTGPIPPIEQGHPALIEEGLLPLSQQPAWQDTPPVRAVRGRRAA
ncbi:MAG TPA: ferritin-like domain-containing protein [Chloroflexota bacterium]|nr:ferritin-like domain-containing protein [Chloroflexota bacterium]